MRTQTMGSSALADQARKIITIEASDRQSTKRLKVAAYARVSTNSEDQINSFSAQTEYYSALIEENKSWSLVDMYADEGISGTSVRKRDDFQRMLSDCRKGKIDRILVKSISRFARNTKECLETIRELKSLGISVVFEKEGIDTGAMSGEMLLSIYACMAQSESESISGNMRWSLQKRMESGAFNTCRAPVGFTLEEAKLQIDEDAALVVFRVFLCYLNGKNSREIAKMLNEEQALGRVWRREAVDYILRNERYAGNALLQKRYTTDTFPLQVKRNKGEKQMYYVKGSNPNVITQEMFELSSGIRKQRKRSCGECHNRMLSKKAFCGCCGSTLRSKQVNGKWYWTCRNHEEDGLRCSLKPVSEPELYEVFLKLYYKLKHEGMDILEEMEANLKLLRNRRLLHNPEILEINNRIAETVSQNQLLAKLKQLGLVDPDIFISQSNDLTEQLRKAKLEREQKQSSFANTALMQTERLIKIMKNGPSYLKEMDAKLFGEIVASVIVDNDLLVTFRLKNGLELPERIER